MYTLCSCSHEPNKNHSRALTAFALTHTLIIKAHFYSLSMRVLIVTGVVNSPRPALVLPATVMLYTVNGIRSVSRSEVSLLGSSIIVISLPVCLLTV